MKDKTWKVGWGSVVKGLGGVHRTLAVGALEGFKTRTSHQNCALECDEDRRRGLRRGKAWRQLGSHRTSLERLVEWG